MTANDPRPHPAQTLSHMAWLQRRGISPSESYRLANEAFDNWNRSKVKEAERAFLMCAFMLVWALILWIVVGTRL